MPINIPVEAKFFEIHVPEHAEVRARALTLPRLTTLLIRDPTARKPNDTSVVPQRGILVPTSKGGA